MSSWVRRIAARYDILADDLVRHVLGWQAHRAGRVERLDHHADAALENALALAAKVDPATIKGLRIVRDDGSASCWHRTRPAWCRACIGADLAERGEVHERAIWRLGCCVLCPEHAVLLDDTCRRCAAEGRCRPQGTKGRLQFECDVCRRPVDPTPGSIGQLNDEEAGALGARRARSAKLLVRDLQGDLQAALTGSPLARSWGFVRSAEGLAITVRDLTFCIVLAERLKVEPRIELPEPKPGHAFAPVYEPITPATLSPGMAFGVLASVAAVLSTLARGDEGRQRWRPESSSDLMSAASFVAWLAPDERRLLRRLTAGWEHRAGEALRSAIDQVEDAAERGSGSARKLRAAA